MFRRKEEGFEDNEAAGDLLSDANDTPIETSDNAPAAAKPAESKADVPEAKPAPTVAKPAPAPSFRPQPAPNIAATRAPVAAETRPTPAPANTVTKASKRILTVGNDIHMKGEISTCDRLVIEGSVDATLKDVHTVELAETGRFKGTAEVEDAEISGVFEGDLTVNGRLIIYSTGQVRGNVSYDEIEIERGGQLSGSIKTSDEAKAAPSNKKSAA